MEKPKYDHQKIEKKWQDYWSKHQTFSCAVHKEKPKYYVLDMFPYPSGSGLHVGHLVGYTATDVVARYKRQQGFNVLHPMGWDSFGLPAEQYAIRTGTHPAITTQENIKRFREQLQSVGYSYDWAREITTSDPKYYKWTQWIFTQLYEKGLAYEADLLVNYCPALGTVVANEEIENGRTKEGGFAVERRPLRQWVLKITAYAERLLNDLDLLDWPEGLKKLQQNWIGKSDGAMIDFAISETKDTITVFTTRPDTIFGATYILLAPEHPLVNKITTSDQKDDVVAYQKATTSKSDLERTELAKTKTGVFTGGYAHHPITDDLIPIWIADYVLLNYATGAVMAVPAHDERDFEFAQEFHLPIKPVIIPDDIVLQKDVLHGDRCWTGSGVCINSVFGNFIIGGMNSEEAKKAVTDWLQQNSKGKATIHYKLRDWLFSRQRYWGEPFPILHFEDGSRRALEIDELPLCPPEVQEYKPSPTGESPLAKVDNWVNIIDSKTGQPARRETNTMPQWAGSCWYYLRFCDPTNDQEAWGKETEQYWMPVDLYVGGAEHAVLHLLYSRFWHKVLYDCGYVSTLEPFQTLCNQGLIVARSFQTSNGSYVAPEDVIEENGTYVHSKTREELRTQIDKMSKSKLNGVTPDQVIEEFGADALRMYIMFMGPLEKEKVWNTDAVSGCKRFLNRFFDMVTSDKLNDDDNEEAMKLAMRLVHGVKQDIEALLFNTAIAKMMEFLNEFTKLEHYPRKTVKMAIQALSSFAPHFAEELWQYVGEKNSIAYEPYPIIEAKYLEDQVVTYVVQVNGKLRGRFDLPKDQTQDVIVAIAKQNPVIVKHLEGEIKKVIFVPNKLLNFVI